MRTIDRRTFIAGVGGAVVLGACSSKKTTLRSLSVIQPGALNLDYAPVLVAQATGLFRSNHLDVSMPLAQNSTQALQQLVGGNVTVARLLGLQVAQAIANVKAPIVAVATDFQESASQIVSSSQRPVHAVSDLVGKTIGLQTAGGGAETALNVQLKLIGQPPTAVKRIVTGTSAASAAFLANGRADAIVTTIDVLATMRKTNPGLVQFNLTGPNPVFGQVYAVTTQTLRSRRSDLVGCIRGIGQAMDRLADPGKRPAALQSISGSGIVALGDRAEAVDVMGEIAGAWQATGAANMLHFVPDLWAKGVAELVAAGVLHAGADPTAVYDASIVREARG